jgi:hypothetical protein
MPRKQPLRRGAAPPAASIPHKERAQNKRVTEVSAPMQARIRAGERFTRPPTDAQRGMVLNRAQGPLPMRLEAMLMQHGPTAIAFLCDTVAGRIPGMTNQQRLDAATTITTLLTDYAGHQLDAMAALLQHLDVTQLTDDQLRALAEHQHDARGALAALLSTTTMTEVPHVRPA